jgi:hypothetical protein
MTRPLIVTLVLGMLSFASAAEPQSKKRIGIIGLDTSHAISFASLLNGVNAKPEFAAYQVTIAYPYGSRTIEEGYTRMPRFIEQAKQLDIRIAQSIDELLTQVDYVLIETHDGTLHVAQALAVFKAGKPLFIDKPMAANLVDICLIYELGRTYNVPVFTTSSFRYTDTVMMLSAGRKGKVRGADCFGPCQEEPAHASLFWYGIHGVEMLFSIMGTGCDTVARTHTAETDVLVGTWNDKRVGTYRGMRIGKGPYYHFGGFAFAEKEAVPLDHYDGYGYYGLLKEILKFFETRQAPVTADTTLEVYGFMEASSQSVVTGRPVKIAPVIEEARKAAVRKMNLYK